ncbi:MAG TPA: NHL repeat-containing protein [Bryobacteraceae bacterium]|nr:NHL repeat-containing protein [Bryobacteraceae bacterium]
MGNFNRCAALSLLACAGLTGQTGQYTISTVAGGGLLPSAKDATSAAIGPPFSIAADLRGNIFIGIGYGVLKMDSTGALTPVAGMGTPGDSGDGGPALKAQVGGTDAIAVDPAGNLYIAEGWYGRIRKVDTGGIITTVAGSGPVPYFNNGVGDGGPALSAPLFHPYQVAADASGSVYIAEWGTPRIRKVGTDGIITTAVGNGTVGYSGDGGPASQAQIGAAWGLAVDSSGTLWFSDDVPGDDIYPVVTHIRKVTPDGIITTVAGTGVPGYSGDGGRALAAQLYAPGQLTVDDSGNVYFPDNVNIRKVSSDGTISTIAGNGTYGYAGDGGPAVNAALTWSAYGQGLGVAVDTAGNPYIADSGNSRVRKISPDQTISTVAGNGGGCCWATGDEPAMSAQLYSPVGVAVDASGNIFISDTYNGYIRKVTPDGIVHFFAGVGVGPQLGSLQSGVQAATEQLSFPAGMVIGPNGNLYFADAGTERVLMISSDEAITTIAGSVQSGYSGDGGPATSAQLSWPRDIAFDNTGNLYIADSVNNVIRRVDANGVITTIAGTGAAGFSGDGKSALSAQFNVPSGIAVDKNGSVYVSDTNNYRVRKIDPTGVVATIAGTGVAGFSGDGGSAISAQLSYPTGIKVDAAGNLYVADNGAVRRITPDGTITSIAGTGVSGYSGDGGPATASQLNAWGLAFDNAGNIYVASPADNAVRLLRPVGSKQ